MIWEAGDMSMTKPTLKSEILQNLSPRLTKLLNEFKSGDAGHADNDTAYLDDLFRFSSRPKID